MAAFATETRAKHFSSVGEADDFAQKPPLFFSFQQQRKYRHFSGNSALVLGPGLGLAAAIALVRTQQWLLRCCGCVWIHAMRRAAAAEAANKLD